jgi:hypothetical protein
MNGVWILIIGILGILPFIPSDYAFAQTINVTETPPCFLNYTAGVQIWEDCGMGEDWLQASLLGFEWATGGYFSMILAGVLILATYIKYHKAIYPVIIGLSFIPFAFFLFPASWMLFAGMMVVLTIVISIWKIFKNQTSEFN